MSNTDDVKVCKCGMPDRFAVDPAYPVKFDAEQQEYNLVGDGRLVIMYFCFSCGGRLPESKRSKYFTTPDDADETEVRKLIGQTKSIEDVLRILGVPDETFEGLAFPGVDWKRTYRYSTKWKSLFLDVQEKDGGTIEFLYGGRFVGKRLRGRLSQWRRILGVSTTVGAGIVLGATVRLVTMPADPTGHIVSPVTGGIIGLVLALFVLVMRDNDPWRPWRPRNNQ
jgi:hypothetical protein